MKISIYLRSLALKIASNIAIYMSLHVRVKEASNIVAESLNYLKQMLPSRIVCWKTRRLVWRLKACRGMRLHGNWIWTLTNERFNVRFTKRLITANTALISRRLDQNEPSMIVTFGRTTHWLYDLLLSIGRSYALATKCMQDLDQKVNSKLYASVAYLCENVSTIFNINISLQTIKLLAKFMCGRQLGGIFDHR